MHYKYTLPPLIQTPLPELLASIGQQNPQWSCAQIIQKHTDKKPDCICFTWSEVIQQAHNVAYDLSNHESEGCIDDGTKKIPLLPREPGSPPVVVGAVGSNGYNLYLNIMACLFNRWTVLLISPKNNLASIEHLLRTSKCSLLLVEPAWHMDIGYRMQEIIPDLICKIIATKLPITVATTSLLTPIGSDLKVKEAKMPAFYLHTSGSTGHPKVIAWSHDFVLSGIRASLNNFDDYTGLPLYSVAPIIHAMGIIMYYGRTLAHGNLMTFISSPTSKPPSAVSLLTYLPFIKRGIIIVPPSILEELYKLGPDAVRQVVEGTSFIIFGGAPLSVATGNALTVAGMQLVAGYGSTEIHSAVVHLPEKRPEDWEYVHFRQGYDIHLLPIDSRSSLRELIVGPGTDGCPAVINREHPYGFATNDVFEPHPTIPDLWRHHSRKGDITVLSNGEKSSNKQIEELLLRDKRILFVIVVGTGRPMICVVLQPAEHSATISHFLDSIQPTIVHANSVLQKHSRLLSELIIVATPDRPFAITDKGTVKKRETLALFEEDIENAYAALRRGGPAMECYLEGSLNEKNNVQGFLRKILQDALGKQIADNSDLFENGMDSLLAMQLHAMILSAIRKEIPSSRTFPLNIIYTFPTINALTEYVLSQIVRDAFRQSDSNNHRIQKCITKYSTNFPLHRPDSPVPEGKFVALSGSTGSLGSFMFSMLLQMEEVKKVYLLNRGTREDQEARQAAAFRERGIDLRWLEVKKDRIVYLSVDFSRKDLGLSEMDYEDLRDNVTHIIHAAWNLNFNLILESFEAMHIAGVWHLVNLALSSPQVQPPHFTFLSSIAAAAKYKGLTQKPSVGEDFGQALIPEAPIDDIDIVLDQGYGQSKYVSERVLVNASKGGLRVTIVRIGQISGATTNGAWTRSEHVPIMLRSCLALGMVPNDLSFVRWVPSDIAASIILKQALRHTSGLTYFSVENPYPTDWNIIVRALSAASPTPLRGVTLATWLKHIRESNPDPEKVPAIKLLGFFETITREKVPTAALAWEKSVDLSPELAVGPISDQLADLYISYQQKGQDCGGLKLEALT